jgi:hypothetical protein
MSNFQEKLDQYRQLQGKSGFQQKLQSYREQPPIVDTPPTRQGPSFLERNLDIPLGMGGSLAGAATGGMIAGPPGAIIGGVVGGATGTGVGSYVSAREYEGTDEISAYKKAVEDALWSMGFDIATMGVVTKVKPMWYAAKSKMGLTAEEAGKELIEGQFGAGSQESLRASQALLMKGGATLLPSQVRTSGLDNFRERVASVGLISRQTMEDNLKAVNDVVQDELTTLVNKNAPGLEADPYSMGEAFYTLIQEGKGSIQNTYVRGLDELKMKLGAAFGKRVGTESILRPLDTYLIGKRGEAVDELSPESIQFLNSQLSRLRELPAASFPIAELITLDKAFTQRVTAKFGPQGAERNSVVEAELADVASQLRTAIYNSMQRVDPQAAESYKALKEAYGQGINTLFPPINKSFMRGAGEGKYLGLGNLAAQATNLNQISAMKKSLSEAFKQASKDPNIDLPFQSVEQIDQIFKRGFLSSRVSNIFDDTFVMTRLKPLADKTKVPAEDKKFRYVLGKDYPRFRQVMNIVLEASESASGDFGNLWLRGAEAGGVKGIAQAVVAGAGGTYAATGAVSLTPLVSAGALALYVPQVFANVVTNPEYVKRLINVSESNGAIESANIAMQLLVADVLDNMTDVEKNGVVDYLTNIAQERIAPTQQETGVQNVNVN